ncbi:hypothetical protein CPB86DRAFT_419541 [Serendipita vermifera]|nr:hypothetical protein CPB86DRAFT_419541 [Serendipita vermifera]
MSTRERPGQEEKDHPPNSNPSGGNKSTKHHHLSSSKRPSIPGPKPYERSKEWTNPFRKHSLMSKYHDSNAATVSLTGDISVKRSRSHERMEPLQSSMDRGFVDGSSKANQTHRSTSARSSPRGAYSDIGHHEYQSGTIPLGDPTSSARSLLRKQSPNLSRHDHQNEVVPHGDEGYGQAPPKNQQSRVSHQEYPRGATTGRSNNNTNTLNAAEMDEAKPKAPRHEEDSSSRRNQAQKEDFTSIRASEQERNVVQPQYDLRDEPESPETRMDMDHPEPDQETTYATASEKEFENHQGEYVHVSQSNKMELDQTPEEHQQDQERRESEHGPSREEARRRKDEAREEERKRKEANRQAQMKQYKELEAWRNRLEGEIKATERETNGLVEEMSQLDTTSQRLQSEWEETEKQLAKHRELLNASRAFSSREGTIDAQGLLQPFNDLNSSIGDFAYQVLCSVNEEEGGKVVEEDTYILLFKELGGNVSKEMLKVLQPGQLTVMDVIDSLLQYAICTSLYNVIFEDFVPGLSKYQDDVARLDEMYRRMCQVEPQERTARWRAITFNRASALADENFLEDKSKECLRVMETILKTLSPSSILPETCTSALLAIFKAAFAVQKKAKTEYISYDYEVKYVSFRKRFHDTTMEACQGKPRTTPEYVCMTTLFGLVAKKRTMKERNGEWIAHEERSVPVKATVICDNWDPNA